MVQESVFLNPNSLTVIAHLLYNRLKILHELILFVKTTPGDTTITVSLLQAIK